MTPTSRRRALLGRWGLLVAYSALIFVLSSRSDLPEIERLEFPGADKIQHGVAYAVWGFLGSSAVSATWPGLSRPAVLCTAWLLGALYGASDELHQRFVPGREADPLDLAVDAAGSLLGAALHAAWRWRRERRR